MTNQLKNAKGAWIFMAHSTKDWAEVREVRNYLETKGCKPLLFFLKCLTDNPELMSLIHREIDARRWFINCDSENARSSDIVQKEVAYIEELMDKDKKEGKAKRQYLKIDVTKDLGLQMEDLDLEPLDPEPAFESYVKKIDHLCKRATVFLSYSRRDESHAERLRTALVENEFSVWDPSDLKLGQSWAEQISGAIDKAVEWGFVLALMSMDSVHSEFVRTELKSVLERFAAKGRNAIVIPIMLDNPMAIMNALPPDLRFILGGFQWFDCSQGDFDQNVASLIDQLITKPWD